MAVPSPCLLYHFVHLDNLAGIAAAGGLVCKSDAASRGVTMRSIASEGIQQRRATTLVPLGGTLHDYVPFYFAPRSPMMHRIYRGEAAEYAGPQEDLVYLVTTVERVLEADLPFTFTLGHATVEPREFRTDVAALAELDWPVLQGKWWNNTASNPDRMRRRQAEFLVGRFVPLDVFVGLAAHDEGRAVRAAAAFGDRLRHRVRPDWYY